MKRLILFLVPCLALITSSCSQNQPYQVELAEISSTQSPNSQGCDQPLMGPLAYEQYFPTAKWLSQFVRRIHQDRQGNFWFGTNGDGVIRYDGDSLQYFAMPQGFGGMAVRQIAEDENGNLWFATENGLSKYSNSTRKFTNYTKAEGLLNPDTWSLTIDSKGTIWVGTLMGAFTFDGNSFTQFTLPETEPDHSRGVTSNKIVHSIMEDSKGQMWFATNNGAYIYDGKTLSNLSVKDGMCGRVVNDILEDTHGNFWFATHHHGVCRWNGESFTHFDENDGIQGSETWSLFLDSKGGVWFPTEGYGVYRFDGEHFAHYSIREGLASKAIQCIFEDQKGQIWCGGWMGLFRLQDRHFTLVNKKGPWADDGC